MDGQSATVKSDETTWKGRLIKIHLLLPEGAQTSVSVVLEQIYNLDL